VFFSFGFFPAVAALAIVFFFISPGSGPGYCFFLLMKSKPFSSHEKQGLEALY
jgi:hypothetical protein